MSDDVRPAQARREHAAAAEAEAEADRHREKRDRLVAALRKGDPERWSYGKLAKAVGCSPELIAAICRRLLR